MDSFDHALNAFVQLLVQIGDMLVAAVVAAELWLRGQLATLGVAPPLQSAIMIGLAIVLILSAFRLFGGLIRMVVVLVLVLVVVHIVMPLVPH
jgi:hypothetical protein